MKITPSPIRNINFKYNKQYHTSIQQKLDFANTATSKALKSMDEYFNGLEDAIIAGEKMFLEQKTGADNPDFISLTDFLIDMKQAICYQMDLNFPKFDYTNRLIETYLNELEQFKNKLSPLEYMKTYGLGWRTKLISILAGISSKDYSDKMKKLNIPINKELSENKKTTDDIRKQALDDANQKELNNILTIYEPNKYSPKGFKDVVGMEDIKEMFEDDLIDYIKNPELLEQDEQEYGIRIPRGFLFYGPPGCGKTFIVQALAAECGLKMYKMDISKVSSRYVNQTSLNIEKAFDIVSDAAFKEGKPVILFMDEIDSLAFERGSQPTDSGENSKTTSTLLKKIENAREENIIIIAATNKFDMIDNALKQRFDVQKYLPLPDEKQIESLITTYLSKIQKGQNLAQNSKEIKTILKQFKGYSNRQIVQILDRAVKIAKKDSRNDINSNHIKEAIEKCNLIKVNDKDFKRKEDLNKNKIGFGQIF